MKTLLGVFGLLMFSHSGVADIEPAGRFTGWYLGFNAGLLTNGVSLKATHAGFTQMIGVCDSGGDFLSFAPGAQIGFLYELESKVTLGLEAGLATTSTRLPTWRVAVHLHHV